jgi:hypothetical protein
MKNLEKILPVIAIVVALGSATFSFFQSQTSAAQFKLVEQQLRPHVSYTPTFFVIKDILKIDMYLQNQSPLPANVLYDDLAVWLDEQPLAKSFHSISPDILYQDKGGISSLPLIEGKVFQQIKKSQSILTIGTCTIYASTSQSDHRRWQLLALHEYIPGTILPKRLLIREEIIENSISKCSAEKIRSLHISEQSKKTDLSNGK